MSLELELPPPLAGIRQDMPRHGLPPQYCWDAANVMHRGTSLVKVPGYVKRGSTLLGRVQTIFPFLALNGTVSAIALTSTDAYVWDGADWSRRTRGMPTPVQYTPGSRQWIVAQVPRQDVLLATNSRDQVQKWLGTGNFQDVGGSPPFTRADGVFAFRDYVVYLATTEGGTYRGFRVRWTDQNAYETYTGGLSGFQDLAGSDRNLWLRPISNDVALIYRDRSMWAMRYVGAPLVFAFEQLVDKTGQQAYFVNEQFQARHVFLGTDTIYETDGAGLRPASDLGRLLIFNRMNTAKRDAIQLLQDLTGYQRYWFYANPLAPGDYANEAVIEDFEEIHGRDGAWWKRTDISPTGVGLYLAGTTTSWNGLTGTWLDQQGPWLQPDTGRATLAWGDVDGNVYELSHAINDGNGTAINTSFESGLFDAASMLLERHGPAASRAGFRPGAKVMLIEVRVSLEYRGTQLYFVDIAAVDSPAEALSWFTIEIPLGATNEHFAGVSLRGRYFAYRVRSTGLGAYPVLAGLRLTFVPDALF